MNNRNRRNAAHLNSASKDVAGAQRRKGCLTYVIHPCKSCSANEIRRFGTKIMEIRLFSVPKPQDIAQKRRLLPAVFDLLSL
ncbi:MAG: hypothetical protein MJ102_06230 [Clostridia bacterium]|nr:hypothetical protein [Clostridia bacterium]